MAVAALALCAATATPAWAALDIGDKAPDFTTQASLAGKPVRFALSETLAKGPVVLYFFPAAFSIGCSIEAHEFAESMDKFEALGATVIGVSGDDVETLDKFSVQGCQGRFPVASDANQQIIKSYDAAMSTRADYANRVSYVIAPNGFITYQYTSLNPYRHVERTLAAVKDLQDKAKKSSP